MTKAELVREVERLYSMGYMPTGIAKELGISRYKINGIYDKIDAGFRFAPAEPLTAEERKIMAKVRTVGEGSSEYANGLLEFECSICGKRVTRLAVAEWQYKWGNARFCSYTCDKTFKRIHEKERIHRLGGEWKYKF